MPMHACQVQAKVEVWSTYMLCTSKLDRESLDLDSSARFHVTVGPTFDKTRSTYLSGGTCFSEGSLHRRILLHGSYQAGRKRFSLVTVGDQKWSIAGRVGARATYTTRQTMAIAQDGLRQMLCPC